jgi:hypothetical protein
MTILYTKNNTPYRLELKPFAGGGEGEVFKLISPNNTNQCAKIYFPNQRTKEKEDKIKFIINNTNLRKDPNLYLHCFPSDILYDKQKNFVGFLMPIAFRNSIQLYELVTTRISKNLFPEWHSKYNRNSNEGIHNRLKLCANIAIAVHAIHETNNFVLVDFKPQNILITNDGKISIIDLDSIQVSKGNKVLYPSKVATPEYSPKEVSILNPSLYYISESWDRFSLSVVFYEILFGIHPYVATANGQYANYGTISEKISNNLFVHGSKKNYLTTIPAVHNNFSNLPISLQNLFISTFEEGSFDPSKRISAETWARQITIELKSYKSILPYSTIQIPNPPSKYPTTHSTINHEPKKSSSLGSFILLVSLLIIILFIYLSYTSNQKSTNSIDSNAIFPSTELTDPSSIPNPIYPLTDTSNISLGRVVFWTQISYGASFEVKLENGESDYITEVTNSRIAPECGESGYATFDLVPGVYKFRAELTYVDFDGNSDYWQGEVIINAGQCLQMELSK